MRLKISDRFDYGDTVGFKTSGKDRVQQSFKKECDINSIVAKIQKGNFLPIKMGTPQFGDFSQVGSYHEALIKLREANDAFESMPSAIRDRFENDPEKLITFLSDVKNTDEAVALGLVVRKVVDKPAEKPAVPPVP